MTWQRWWVGACICAMAAGFTMWTSGCITTNGGGGSGGQGGNTSDEPDDGTPGQPDDGTSGGTDQPTAPADDDIIFSNDNVYGVANGPTEPVQFTINRRYRITLIRNYHWNDGLGTPQPGTITLRAANNSVIGRWTCTAFDGQNNTPNVHWSCAPYVDIPPGTYTVEDSDPATWSCNGSSGNAGICTVRGIPLDDISPPDTGSGDDPDGSDPPPPDTGSGDDPDDSDTGSGDDPDDSDPPPPDDTERTAIVRVFASGWATTVIHEFPWSVHPEPADDMTDTGLWGMEFECRNCDIQWSGNSFLVEDDYTRITGTLAADGQSVIELNAVRTDRIKSHEGYTEHYELSLANLPVTECPTGWPTWGTCFAAKATEGDLHQYVTTLADIVFGEWIHPDGSREIMRMDTVTSYDLNYNGYGEIEVQFSAVVP